MNKAWDNDKVSGDALKPLKKISKLLKRGSNARDRVLSIEEVNLLIDALPLHAIKTKDNEKRLVPIPDTLFEYLVKIPKSLHDDHVFLFRGEPLKSIRASLKKVCESTGIPYGRNTKNGIIPARISPKIDNQKVTEYGKMSPKVLPKTKTAD